MGSSISKASGLSNWSAYLLVYADFNSQNLITGTISRSKRRSRDGSSYAVDPRTTRGLTLWRRRGYSERVPKGDQDAVHRCVVEHQACTFPFCGFSIQNPDTGYTLLKP